jgi:phosphatidylserine/phosphatidylglycerophosphate/cardiolipin synthase-like enzyme
VVIHNAYFLPPANIMTALSRMVNGDLDCHNVTVTVLTNSIESTDLNIVNLLARHTVKAFGEYTVAHRVPARSARFEYFEYEKAQGSALVSLHTKLEMLGPDLIVGSANADVRSYMRDSNNAMFIRNAPELVYNYGRYVDGLLHDPTRTRNRTDYYLTTPREQMLTEDLQTLEMLLAKYRADRHLSAAQLKAVEQQFIEILNLAYTLSRELLEGGRAGKAAEEKFNRTFKAI